MVCNEFWVIGLGAWIMLEGLVAIVKKWRGSSTATSRYLELSVPGWIAFVVGTILVVIGAFVQAGKKEVC